MKKFTVKPRLTQAKRIWIGNPSENEHIFFGRLAEMGPTVGVHFDLSLPHVMAIFGKRGSGKSYTLGSFLEGLCTKSTPNSISATQKRHAILLFDTLGIFQWMDIPLSAESKKELLKEQIQAQRGWDIKSEPLNIEIWAPKSTPASHRQYKEYTVDCSDFTASDWGYLFNVDILQDRMGQLLNDTYEKVVHEGWSDEKTITHSPQPRYAIEDLIDCVQQDPELINNYHRETRRAIFQLLTVYWRNPLFQPKRRIPAGLSLLKEKGELSEEDLKAYESLEGVTLNELLKPGQLSILLLHKIPDELRFVLILAIIRKIMKERIETSEAEKNLKILPDLTDEIKIDLEKKVDEGIPPTWVAVDEAQNFLPSERKTTATDTLIRLVREGRNYGLSFILTTQQPSAIDQRILSQVDSLVVHKLTVQGDVEYIKRNLKAAQPDETKFGTRILTFDDLLRSLDVGQAVVSNTDMDRTFIMDIRPRVSTHGGFGI